MLILSSGEKLWVGGDIKVLKFDLMFFFSSPKILLSLKFSKKLWNMPKFHWVVEKVNMTASLRKVLDKLEFCFFPVLPILFNKLAHVAYMMVIWMSYLSHFTQQPDTGYIARKCQPTFPRYISGFNISISLSYLLKNFLYVYLVPLFMAENFKPLAFESLLFWMEWALKMAMIEGNWLACYWL